MKKSRPSQVEEKENVVKVEIGSGQHMVEILHEEAVESDDSDIIYVKTSFDSPREVTKCTPKTEPESSSEATTSLPVVIPFAALSTSSSGSVIPSPTSPTADKETASDIEGNQVIDIVDVLLFYI